MFKKSKKKSIIEGKKKIPSSVKTKTEIVSV